MTDAGQLGSYDDTPIYTIKTVVQQTGILPATLRAWERRYGCLSPSRSDSGYRLYSERDMATLRWLKGQVDAGVSISRAVALLDLQRQASAESESSALAKPTRTQMDDLRTTRIIGAELLVALLSFQESQAEQLLAEAFALYTFDVVTEEIIAPVLVEVGERWYRREATVVQEHFATAFLHRRLATLFHAYGQPTAGPLAFAGTVSGEWHDIGILLIALALRRHGWRVFYLGQNVPVAHLIEEIRHLRPSLVCLSATTDARIDDLTEVVAAMARLSEPKPRLVLGGRILNAQPELRARFPGAYLAANARDLIATLTQS